MIVKQVALGLEPIIQVVPVGDTSRDVDCVSPVLDLFMCERMLCHRRQRGIGYSNLLAAHCAEFVGFYPSIFNFAILAPCLLVNQGM
jgi:hypothetical protein